MLSTTALKLFTNNRPLDNKTYLLHFHLKNLFLSISCKMFHLFHYEIKVCLSEKGINLLILILPLGTAFSSWIPPNNKSFLFLGRRKYRLDRQIFINRQRKPLMSKLSSNDTAIYHHSLELLLSNGWVTDPCWSLFKFPSNIWLTQFQIQVNRLWIQKIYLLRISVSTNTLSSFRFIPF